MCILFCLSVAFFWISHDWVSIPYVAFTDTILSCMVTSPLLGWWMQSHKQSVYVGRFTQCLKERKKEEKKKNTISLPSPFSTESFFIKTDPIRELDAVVFIDAIIFIFFFNRRRNVKYNSFTCNVSKLVSYSY